MARTVKQLTATQIINAKPKEKKYYLSDGLGLRICVYPNGSKIWLFNYIRPYLKKRTDKTIGAYPAVSLADARTKAQEYREYLAKNLDPQTVEQEKAIAERNKLINTFSAVAREWLGYREKMGKEQNNYSERTKVDTIRRVNYAINVIGDIPFEQLTLKHALSVLEPFRIAGTLFELRKRYLVLKMIAEYAERFGYWDKNVWRYLGEDLPPPPKNHHAAIRYKELPDFLQALRQSRTSYSTLLAILWGY
ncbi:tyrosine-type recombinase/integrase [Rodentibacter pneumotropicus]|uniref:tyrosine-type recombinase/integrase n=1 Tax=Rodentibacter pneumotropicus TaxID=758 RepID=UPI0026745874|nr:integrase arm-type DNA-binding domain-containing protein [Rodentibacter pneumotropicus]